MESSARTVLEIDPAKWRPSSPSDGPRVAIWAWAGNIPAVCDIKGATSCWPPGATAVEAEKGTKPWRDAGRRAFRDAQGAFCRADG
jgi:hypothetical protein